MRQLSPSLDRSILGALEAAYSAGRSDVAEHLLCALECLCDEAGETTAVDEAYRIVCSDHSRGSKRLWHSRHDLKT